MVLQFMTYLRIAKAFAGDACQGASDVPQHNCALLQGDAARSRAQACNSVGSACKPYAADVGDGLQGGVTASYGARSNRQVPSIAGTER